MRKSTIACLVVSGSMAAVSLCFDPTSTAAKICGSLSLTGSLVVLTRFWMSRRG